MVIQSIVWTENEYKSCQIEWKILWKYKYFKIDDRKKRVFKLIFEVMGNNIKYSFICSLLSYNYKKL